uniref:Uncharacterized protein n=1 Tax=viral metagenome TaxID=1070528 RepID=A0A6C0HWD4_9ZZZZ
MNKRDTNKKKLQEIQNNNIIKTESLIEIIKKDGLELLKDVFEKKIAQKGLIMLYSQSQTECTRNGMCGMEVGMSREKDQGAVLKLFLGDKINLDIDNSLPEDYIIGKEKISAKHTSSKVGSTVKVKWTSADISVKDAIKSMIEADDSYYSNLLLTYFDIKNKKIIIICITSEHNKNIIKTLKEKAFKIPGGNSRGIEYSTMAMKELFKNIYFKVEIENADLKGGINPIDRRVNLLKSIGITP